VRLESSGPDLDWIPELASQLWNDGGGRLVIPDHRQVRLESITAHLGWIPEVSLRSILE